jgi:hypothetical protein
MNVFGQLKKACMEILSSQPSGSVQGRLWYNSTSGKAEFDNGTQKRALLANDDKAVVGNSGTAANNIRLHRGANQVLQQVLGNDVTAEGSLSSALAQSSSRVENYTDAGKPAFGNAGRLVYLTDLFQLLLDVGTSWVSFVDTNSTQTLSNKTIDLGTITNSTMDVSANTVSNVAVSNMTSGAEPSGKVPKSDGSGGVSWESTTSQSVVRSVTTTDTATESDDTLVLSGASFTQTLFACSVSNVGKIITLIHNGTSLTDVYTINPTGGDTGLGVKMHTNGQVLKVQVITSSSWKIIDSKTATTPTAFTPATTSTFSTNTTWTGQWWREGKYAVIEAQAAFAGAPNAASLFLNFPTGITLDTSAILGGVSTFLRLGTNDYHSGTAYNYGILVYSSTSRLQGRTIQGASNNPDVASSASLPFVIGSGDKFVMRARFPVVDWIS